MHQTVWIHGAALGGHTWAPQPLGLVPDLPGHNAAARLQTPTVRAYAKALEPTLPAQFTMVGHSLGGMIAMDIAARMPERCRALVLVDPPLRMPLWVLRRYGRVFARIAARVPGPKGIAALMALRVERPASRPLVKSAIGSMTRGGLRDAMIASVGFDGRALIPKLAMPTLVLLGKRSLLTGPRTARTFKAGLPNGTVETWESGHMIPFDLPEQFFKRVDFHFRDNRL